MRISLINPRNDYMPNPPLGLLYIGASLEKAGHTVKMFDEFPENEDIMYDNIQEFDPEANCVTVMTTQLKKALEIATRVKEICPESKNVFGGIHPTVLPKQVLTNTQVDYVVIGEGEETIVELFSGRKRVSDILGIGYKIGDEIHINGRRPLIKDLDTIPFPAWHLLPSPEWYFQPPRIRGVWSGKIAVLIASRGCIEKCIFCSTNKIFGRVTRWRSTENVIEEIEYLQREYGITAIYFNDDGLTMSASWIKKFCRQVKGLGIKWACQARADAVTEEMIADMEGAGCSQIDYGVEHGSQRMLDVVRKGETIEDIKRAFKITKASGIQAMATFIVGSPGETLKDIHLTEKLVDEIKPDFAVFSLSTPYPGSELERIAKENNLIDTSIDYSDYYFSKQSDAPVMGTGYLSPDELVKIRTMLHNKVVWRNYKTMLSSWDAIIGITKMTILGLGGTYKGFKRFFNTGEVASIGVEIMASYRRRTKG